MRTEAVRLSLSDAASFAVLTEHFRSQVETCHQMAEITVNPFKWLEFAAEWTKAVLKEHFRSQAQTCHQMAQITMSPFKQGWLEFAAEWTKLAQETEGRSDLINATR